MGQKQCGKCGELVDEAKAFCPGCGHAFDDEKKRTSVSDFDRSNPTVNLGATMFNKMLSDMGLNISNDPNKPQPQKGRVEVITPVVQSAQPTVPASSPTPQPVPVATRSRSRTWLIVAIIAGILLFILAAIIILVAFILYFRLTG